MHSEPHCQRQHRRRFLPGVAGPVERAEPAEVILKVRGGHAVESGDPGLQSTVMRMDVLDVPGPAQALPGAQVHRLVVQVQFVGGCSHGSRAISAQDGVAVDAGLERLTHAGLGDRFQKKVDRRPGPVTDHQN